MKQDKIQINVNFPIHDGVKTKSIYLTREQHNNISSLSERVQRNVHNFIIHVLSMTLDCEENGIIDKIEKNGNGSFNKFVVNVLDTDTKENGKEYFKKQRLWILKQQRSI